MIEIVDKYDLVEIEKNLNVGKQKLFTYPKNKNKV